MNPTQTSSFSWLHLTDFHFGLAEQQHLWPNLRQPFFDDLAKLHAKTGPWDVVFFTGDLVQQGTQGEFAGMQKEVLDKLWQKLADLGSGNAQLLAVPGNHDLRRPDPEADNAAVDALLADSGFTGIEDKFWRSKDNSYRQVITTAFAEYTNWWNNMPHRLVELSYGELPGDFACTLPCGAHRIGIVGLNTAFLQLKGGDFKGKLAWNVRQLSAVCDSAADEWVQNHSLCLLLTHHGPEWLTSAAKEVGQTEIAPAGRFALHLYGHMHEHALAYLRHGGSPDASRQCQGSSVFGMEKFGDPPQTQRSHGYAAGRIDFTTDSASLRIWPRVATDKPSGWRFIPDNANCHLEDDGGTQAEALTIRPLVAPAPVGATPDASPLPASATPAIPTSAVLAIPHSSKLYGRDALMQQASQSLQKQPFLLIYGMRGNGKTEFIKALAERAPLQGKELIRITLDPTISVDYLFRQLANLLGDTSELPCAPRGDVAAIATEINRRYPNPRPAWIWLDQAHHVFSAGVMRSDIHQLLQGLHSALGNHWHWVLELRERPSMSAFSANGHQLEVSGLDKSSLSQWLKEAAPAASKEKWTYSGMQLTAIFQWLGTGHENRAHPLATQILIEVALGLDETPHQVLLRHREDLDQGIENRLLGDLYNRVLSHDEQRFILALALYRSAIPHDHLEPLEQALAVTGAWDDLDRRCLLPASADSSKFYLHSFIAGWLRNHQLGYAEHGEDGAAEFAEATTAATQQHVRSLHAMIANCWLKQLGSSRKATIPNIERALEAFHHLIAAGDADHATAISTHMLGGNLEWAKQRMKMLGDHLHKTGAPNEQLLKVLAYRATLDPDDHAVQRFLGECWARKEGKASARALECFEKACRLRRDFPQYWANLGRTLLAQGPAGASDFLQRLAELEQDCPQAINDHIRAIQADCLKETNDPAAATRLRLAQINANSRNPAFYADEAVARRDAGDLSGALEILDMAEQRSIANAHIHAIRASVLQHTDPTAAANLRLAQINADSRNPTFYADEAVARRDAGDLSGALEILDLAEQRGIANAHIHAIRTSVLQHTDPTAAANLRLAQINADSRHPAFYADEAVARRDAGDLSGALEILDLAEQRGITDEYIRRTRASVLKLSERLRPPACAKNGVPPGVSL